MDSGGGNAEAGGETEAVKRLMISTKVHLTVCGIIGLPLETTGGKKGSLSTAREAHLASLLGDAYALMAALCDKNQAAQQVMSHLSAWGVACSFKRM